MHKPLLAMCVTSWAAGVMIGNYCGGVRVTIIMKNDGSSGYMVYGESTWCERVKVEFGWYRKIIYSDFLPFSVDKPPIDSLKLTTITLQCAIRLSLLLWMPSFKRHDVDGMKSLSWAYMVRDYSVQEGGSKSTGPRVIGWYVRCTDVHWSIWYIVRHVVRRLL